MEHFALTSCIIAVRAIILITIDIAHIKYSPVTASQIESACLMCTWFVPMSMRERAAYAAADRIRAKFAKDLMYSDTQLPRKRSYMKTINHHQLIPHVESSKPTHFKLSSLSTMREFERRSERILSIRKDADACISTCFTVLVALWIAVSGPTTLIALFDTISLGFSSCFEMPSFSVSSLLSLIPVPFSTRHNNLKNDMDANSGSCSAAIASVAKLSALVVAYNIVPSTSLRMTLLASSLAVSFYSASIVSTVITSLFVCYFISTCIAAFIVISRCNNNFILKL